MRKRFTKLPYGPTAILFFWFACSVLANGTIVIPPPESVTIEGIEYGRKEGVEKALEMVKRGQAGQALWIFDYFRQSLQGDPAVETIEKVFSESSDVKVRFKAIRALSAIQDVRSIPVFLKALKDGNSLEKLFATGGLRRVKEAPRDARIEALKALVELLYPVAEMPFEVHLIGHYDGPYGVTFSAEYDLRNIAIEARFEPPAPTRVDPPPSMEEAKKIVDNDLQRLQGWWREHLEEIAEILWPRR